MKLFLSPAARRSRRTPVRAAVESQGVQSVKIGRMARRNDGALPGAPVS